ncbi:hypothetical protein VPG91_22625 [Nitrospirillum amazonense]|uniref:hypothetical protein n=1 Tax=Nitrospirillum amazonense TaxID=28077 RepID=UPI002DD42E46|nr:hypothetical protein [Nitrospirillum amazonense]MEC4593813.1 hypothetical protein [Nitrospirillum amazonense]
MKSSITLILAALLVGISFAAAAQADRNFVGKWSNLSLELTGRQGQCRSLDVITRSYDLHPAMNHTVEGLYTRQLQRVWLAPPATAGCLLAGQHANKDFMLRFDNWAITPVDINTAEESSFTAILIGCTGDCGDDWKLQESFALSLRHDGDRVVETVRGSSPMILRRSEDREGLERRADAAFMPLMRPLLQGDCNEFYRSSLDGSTHRQIPQDKFCQFGRDFSVIIGNVTTDKHKFAFAPASAILSLGPVTMLLGDGDVLVQRILELNGESNYFLTAALREQPDHSWRVLGLVF